MNFRRFEYVSVVCGFILALLGFFFKKETLINAHISIYYIFIISGVGIVYFKNKFLISPQVSLFFLIFITGFWVVTEIMCLFKVWPVIVVTTQLIKISIFQEFLINLY